MSLPSTPNDADNAVWKAARMLPQYATWDEVSKILEARDIDISARTEATWMELFHVRRAEVEETRKLAARGHSPPADDSPTVGGMPQFPNSRDILEPQSGRIVISAEDNEWFPDGNACIWYKISDRNEEDSILEPIVERLKCRIVDGRVALTFARRGVATSLIRKFRVRPYGTQDVDVLFGTDPWKAEAKEVSGWSENARTDDRHANSPGSEIDYSPSRPRVANEQPQQPANWTEDAEVAQNAVSQAVGIAMSKAMDLLNLDREQAMNAGDAIGTVCLSAIRSIRAQVLPAEPAQDRGRAKEPTKPKLSTRRSHSRNAP